MYFPNEMIYIVTINQCKTILFSIFFVTIYILYKIIFIKKNNIKQQICNEIKTILYSYYADQLDNIKLSENRIIKINKNLLELYNEKKQYNTYEAALFTHRRQFAFYIASVCQQLGYFWNTKLFFSKPNINLYNGLG